MHWEDIMEEKNEEKYLGDIISNDGRNLNNIKARVNKGKGIVSKILSIIDVLVFLFRMSPKIMYTIKS